MTAPLRFDVMQGGPPLRDVGRFAAAADGRRGKEVDWSGFITSGDIGHLDEEGWSFISDRRSDVRRYIAGRIAPYKVPRRVEFVDELPREATGKLHRRKLRDAFRADGNLAGTGHGA